MEPISERPSRVRTKRLWAIGLAAAVVLGAVLRLAWVMDMEYKGDEAWTFDRAQQVGRTEPFLWLGMRSSTAIRNPGMSLWIFVLLSRLFAAHDPPALARAVQLVNVLAILLLLVFTMRWIDGEEREPWLWAVALISVNPLAVLFQRKIWPPSVLPIFTVLFVMGWWNRQRQLGSFLWGLVGAWLGQIHMSGFFCAGGFLAWAVFFDPKRAAWRSWLCGSCLGAVALIPWLQYVAPVLGARRLTTFTWAPRFEFKFWTYWATEPIGLSLGYSLGPQFGEFLGYPLISGRPTYLALLLHVVISAAGVLILARAARQVWRERDRWRDLWMGKQSPTTFTLSAAFWGCGILLTASSLKIHRHYMAVTVPLECVWLAWMALTSPPRPSRLLPSGRALLVALCVSQAALSATFLEYIHINRGAVLGDYGVSYGAQTHPLHPPRDY
jgi:hypothetical protein